MALVPGQRILDAQGRQLLNDQGQFMVHDPDADPCCDSTWACCLPDGTCTEATCEECESLNGVCHEGSHCADPDFECETSACCRPDGICVDTTPAGCEDLDGIFHEGRKCNDPDFSCLGACCDNLPTSDHCVEITEAACEQVNGRWHGLGTRCDDEGVNCEVSERCDSCYRFPNDTSPSAMRVTFDTPRSCEFTYGSKTYVAIAVYPVMQVFPQYASNPCSFYDGDFGHIIHRRYGADGLEHETTSPLTAGVRIYPSNITVFIRKGTTGEHVFRAHRFDYNSNCLSPFSRANQVDFVCEMQQPGSVPARVLGGGSAAVVPIR